MIGPNELIAIAALTFTTLVSIAAAAYALGSLPKRNEFNQLHRDVSESNKALNDKARIMDAIRLFGAEVIPHCQ